MDMQELLMLCVEKKASDLHLTDHEPPILRIDGIIHRTEMASLNREELKKMIYGVLT
ncbi:MAG: twitching motility protein PilT, partial [Candidatus Omnitrophica bacterium]|nr:twitching motility protein PilT [Candidatus Omnitrophota bacterium]